MSYRIQYGEGLTKEIIEDAAARRGSIRILALFTVICVILFVFLNGGEKIRDFLIPGNAEVTRAAVYGFVDNIKEGERVEDAFAAFCLEIIENAEIPG